MKMKRIRYMLLVMALGLFSCQSGKQDQRVLSADRKAVDQRFLIIPGEGVGEIHLGEDMQEVGSLLGKPDFSDAAMGKAWGIWYTDDSTGQNKQELAIYSAYRDTSMRIKEVKQIRLTSSHFKTQNGFNVGDPEKEISLKFRGMVYSSRYLNEEKDTVKIYDARSLGIGVEVSHHQISAISIYPLNGIRNNTYLTLHPEWKAL